MTDDIPVAEVVENCNVIARVQQFNASVGANVAGAARNKNHGKEGVYLR